MAIEKVLGIETEYGIAGGPDQDPILASSIIVNAYAQQGASRINWDFEGETPDLDARGLSGLTAFAPIVETHLANTVLSNGARLYVDHAHPEYSSPECRTPLEATLYDIAGEEVMVNFSLFERVWANCPRDSRSCSSSISMRRSAAAKSPSRDGRAPSTRPWAGFGNLSEPSMASP